jgi:hypothetical protein
VKCRIKDLTDDSVGQWEPAYDPVLWRRENVLHLFMQKVEEKTLTFYRVHRRRWFSVLEWIPH